METSIHSETTPQISLASIASNTIVSKPSSANQVINQFAQIKTMPTSFHGLRPKTTRTDFCNFLAFKVENLKKRDFQAFCDETFKLLSEIQSRAKERHYQPQKPNFGKAWDFFRDSYISPSAQPRPSTQCL